jgi:hypothetical protein
MEILSALVLLGVTLAFCAMALDAAYHKRR